MSYIRQYTDLTAQELRQLGYKRRYKEENSAWDDSLVKLTKLVRERLTGKPVVLDFGCGRGNFIIDELAGSFSEKIGFDVLQESVDGNKTCNRIIIGDTLKLPLPDASVDVIVSLWVFEHLEKPAEALRDIHRVLKPGGFLAFVTPNKHSLLIRLRQLMSDGVAHRLLKILYGREEKDAFSVYYRANTEKDIFTLAHKTGFSPELVMINEDPSYTSFNAFTYRISTWLARFFGTVAKPHLIVVLRKDFSYANSYRYCPV